MPVPAALSPGRSPSWEAFAGVASELVGTIAAGAPKRSGESNMLWPAGSLKNTETLNFLDEFWEVESQLLNLILRCMGMVQIWKKTKSFLSCWCRGWLVNMSTCSGKYPIQSDDFDRHHTFWVLTQVEESTSILLGSLLTTARPRRSCLWKVQWSRWGSTPEIPTETLLTRQRRSMVTVSFN